MLGWLCYALLACTAPKPQRFESEFLAMATRVQLSVLADSPETAARLSAQVERTLQRQGIDWYPWTEDASGELRQLNAALARGERHEVSASLAELLQQSKQVFASSEGYFDPAIAPLTQAWGFSTLDADPSQSLPDPHMLDHWRQSRPTLNDLRIEDPYVDSTRRDLQLDLGGIAKGYAEQRVMQQLQTLGCTDAVINMGGQITVMGTAMASQLAAVAIRDPRADGALATLQLKAGESISTSGDYERFIERDGRRIHHLLDPHTGLPVAHTAAVTVISNDPTLADAASTALMAAGPDRWRRLARQLGVREVLRIDATGAIEVTTALYARLHWLPAKQAHRLQQVAL